MRLCQIQRRDRGAAEQVRPVADGLQMARLDAGAVSAKVINREPCGDGAGRELEDEAMSGHTTAGDFDPTVPVRASHPLPDETAVSLAHGSATNRL
jgi:hypothetical protein